MKKEKCPFCEIGIYNRRLMFRLVGKLSRSQLRRLLDDKKKGSKFL
jgi:hypothetical protein